jgi:hypothetical protein
VSGDIKVKRLSARFVDTIGNPGRYADGDGLYLIVSPKRCQTLAVPLSLAGQTQRDGPNQRITFRHGNPQPPPKVGC